MEKVLVVVGPTGVGKTKLSIELAKKYDGEVISGDSMQIYKTMDIGTAKVTRQEMQGVIHHLIDVKNPDESYSVMEFQETVRQKIHEITKRGKMPILVGGTGLYIKAVLYDYHFEKSESDHEATERKYAHLDNQALYQHLHDIDPEATHNIHPNNRRRVLRAIEIYETTGQKKSSIEAAQNHQMIYDAYLIGLTLPRPLLHSRIDQRVNVMMENGLEEEVDRLMKSGAQDDWQSMKAIGYKEWFDYYRGDKSKIEVVEAIKTHSRQYAKRQYTWFNNQMQVNWYDVNLENFTETVNNVEKDVDVWIK